MNELWGVPKLATKVIYACFEPWLDIVFTILPYIGGILCDFVLDYSFFFFVANYGQIKACRGLICSPQLPLGVIYILNLLIMKNVSKTCPKRF